MARDEDQHYTIDTPDLEGFDPSQDDFDDDKPLEAEVYDVPVADFGDAFGDFDFDDAAPQATASPFGDEEFDDVDVEPKAAAPASPFGDEDFDDDEEQSDEAYDQQDDEDVDVHPVSSEHSQGPNATEEDAEPETPAQVAAQETAPEQEESDAADVDVDVSSDRHPEFVEGSQGQEESADVTLSEGQSPKSNGAQGQDDTLDEAEQAAPAQGEVYDVQVADFGDQFGDSDFGDEGDFGDEDNFEDEEEPAEQSDAADVTPGEVESSQGQDDNNQEAQEQSADDIELPPEEMADLSEEEKAARGAAEEAELESYRSTMTETDAELADVSEYRNFRKTTKTGGPDKSKNKKSDFDIFANRHKAKTLNQAVAQSDPIVYFYNACLTAKGEVMLFNVYQVLQDRFIGKIIPQLFTAVAEASSKIEELNMAALLAAIPVCQEYPGYDFVISISCRFFTKPAVLDRLLKAIPDNCPPNLIFAFDSVSLQNLGVAAKTGLGSIRDKGIKIMLDNTEKVSMTALTELDYDYLRIDARYYEMGNPKAEAYLGMIIKLAQDQGIRVLSAFCDNIDISEYMLYMGVDAIQGNAISKPFRTVPNAVKGITLLETMLEQ